MNFLSFIFSDSFLSQPFLFRRSSMDYLFYLHVYIQYNCSSSSIRSIIYVLCICMYAFLEHKYMYIIITIIM